MVLDIFVVFNELSQSSCIPDAHVLTLVAKNVVGYTFEKRLW